MNKKLKNALKECFEAPVPVEKKAFLRRIPQPSISIFQFILTQAFYIRKRVWGLSTLIFAVALIGGECLERDMLWCISACMPLLSLTLLTESGRSERCGMAEMEMSARFSLKSVMLARLGILGTANLALFCLLIPLACQNNSTDMFQTGVYMACPYLLTTFGGLWGVRKMPGKEAVYLCAGIAVSVSVGSIVMYQSFPAAFAGQSIVWWIAALISFGIGTAKQCRQMVKQTEDLVWS